MARGTGVGLGAVVVGALLACGGNGDGGGGPSTPQVTVAKAPTANGDGQSAVVGTELPEPLRIIVTLDGAPQAGTAVTWNASGTAATVDPASGTTGADGIASTTWTIGQTAGAQSAQASVTGASGSPVTFSATGLPGAPAGVVALAGGGQFGELNGDLDDPLEVEVTDQFGNGVSGVTVSWAVTEGTGTLNSTSTVTAADGSASVRLTLGDTRGAVGVTATVDGLTPGAATFAATAVDEIIQVGNGAATVFVPSSSTIPAGGTVVWIWNSGAVQHNVSTSDGSPDVPGTPSQTRTTPFTFGPMQLNAAGEYRYYCSVHAGPTDAQGMVGTITVQ